MILLNNNFQIVSDGTQYIVKESKRVFSEKENDFVKKETIIGYCSTLDRALKLYSSECIKRKIQKEDLRLNEVKKAIDELKNEIKKYETEGK